MSDLTTSVSVYYSTEWWLYGNLEFEFPDFCPHCNEKGRPNFLIAKYNTSDRIIHSSFECNNKKCKKIFLADYNMWTWSPKLIKIYPKTYLNREFSDTLKELSPQFCKIFNQSAKAESQELDEIAWVWYRKALEFLIKDYLIKSSPEQKEVIENTFLWTCIATYIIDERIKQVSKRAAWLWNDETHYVRKWENKDIEDLKKLIELTINWIQMEIQTKELLIDMPEK
jgi:hypothetical protein